MLGLRGIGDRGLNDRLVVCCVGTRTMSVVERRPEGEMVDSIYQGCHEMVRGSYNIHWVGTSPRKQNCPQDWFSWQQCSPCPFLYTPLNWLLPEVVLAVKFHWMSSPGMGRRNPRNMLGSQLSRTSVLGTCRIRASEALRTARGPSFNRGETQGTEWVKVWSKVTQHIHVRARPGTHIRHCQVIFHTVTL